MGHNYSPILEIVRPYLSGKIKKSGNDNILTLCPFHSDHKASFWLNINNGVWLCFSCGLRGNLKRFLELSNVPRGLIEEVMGPVKNQIELFQRIQKAKQAQEEFSDPHRGDVVLPEALLGVYEYKPNMMIKAGFKPELLRQYDIGYDRRLNRVTFPLRDLYGNLVGISGRATIPGDTPRYKVYQGSHVDDKGEYQVGDFGENFDEMHHNFKVNSHRFLWNSHVAHPMIINDKNNWYPLVITEGFKACLWLIQHGFPTTVALTGASISKTQALLIIRMSGNPIILFLDNDEAGRRATLLEGRKLLRSSNELWVASYPEGSDGCSPDDLDLKQIRRAIYGCEEWVKWSLTSKCKVAKPKIG